MPLDELRSGLSTIPVLGDILNDVTDNLPGGLANAIDPSALPGELGALPTGNGLSSADSIPGLDALPVSPDAITGLLAGGLPDAGGIPELPGIDSLPGMAAGRCPS